MTSKHVLLATDGSPSSLESARLVSDLFNTEALARMTVLAVIPPVNTVPFYGAYGLYGYDRDLFSKESQDALIASAEQTAQKMLQQTVVQLNTTVLVETVLKQGSPADVIVNYAKETGADIIVMGSRGWGEMHAVLLGSVSERVLHSAPCPVLIVRQPK